MPWLYISIGLAVALISLITVVIIRTLLFIAPSVEVTEESRIEVNREKAISDLAEMIKCKTVSYVDKRLEDEAEFDKFKNLLRELFPTIYSACEFTEVGPRALLYKYKGESDERPTVLMAHFDVVAAEETKWDKPPFDAVCEDGVLWGRGTLDTKATLNGAMQALESLIKEGFVPKNDIYLAFAGDEEISGYGARSIVDIFAEQGIIPGAVYDEGGAIVSNVFPNVKDSCALVGIAEKGLLNVRFLYEGRGGHASTPNPHTPIGKLSAACVRIEKRPFRFRICDATREMLNNIARRSSFLYRMIFANLWLFSPLLDIITRKKGGELNALVRTTCAFTKMQGSDQINVIPPKAFMAANLRILPGETVDKTMETLRKRIADEDITIENVVYNEPSVISEVGSEGWNRIVSAIKSTWGNAIVSPYLMFACSDSRHWGRISNQVYRFSAMELTDEERKSIHGNNERITLDAIIKTVEFYKRLIESC